MSARPEPVWVRKEHAATALRAFRADRPGIARGREALTFWIERERGGEWPRPGRPRSGDLHHQRGRTLPAPGQIERTDPPPPGPPSTPAGNAVYRRLGAR